MLAEQAILVERKTPMKIKRGYEARVHKERDDREA